MKNRYDSIYDLLQVKYQIVKDYIDGKIDEDYFEDNFKVEEPEEILYGIVQTATALDQLTGEERFKELLTEASKLYTELKLWKMPAFHL